MRALVGFVYALVLGSAGLVSAAPLNPKDVAADANVVVHVDFDAVRNSALWAKCQETFPEMKLLQLGIVDALKTNRIDPSTDLKGVTFYGPRLEKGSGQGVLIVHAALNDSAVSFLVDKVKQLPGHEAVEYGSQELHLFRQPHLPGPRIQAAGAYVRPDHLVLGSPDDVKAAIDVLAGKKPSLADKSSPLAGPSLPGAIAAIRMTNLPILFAGAPAKSPILKRVESASGTVGATANELYGVGQLVVDSTEVAQEAKDALKGCIAVGLLTSDNAELANVLKAVKVDATGTTVSVDVKVSTDEVWPKVAEVLGQLSDLRKQLSDQGVLGGKATKAAAKAKEESQKQIREAEEQLNRAKKQLDAAQKQLEEAKNRFSDEQKQLEKHGEHLQEIQQ